MSLSNQQKRTKRHLKDSFILLIRQKGYQSVRVTDIVHHAQYNRTTFYHYYEDKQQIANEILEDLYNMVQCEAINRYPLGRHVFTSEMDENSFGLMYYIYDHQSLFQLFSQKDSIPGIQNVLPDAIYTLLEDKFVFVENAKLINSNDFKLYMTHGTVGLIIDWIEKDFQNTPNEMTNKLNRILHRLVKTFVVHI